MKTQIRWLCQFNQVSIKKEQKSFDFCSVGSGSGIRTARPSGYEPDELPTALSRDIGLQIYGHFLKLQILFTKNVFFCNLLNKFIPPS